MDSSIIHLPIQLANFWADWILSKVRQYVSTYQAICDKSVSEAHVKNDD